MFLTGVWSDSSGQFSYQSTENTVLFEWCQSVYFVYFYNMMPSSLCELLSMPLKFLYNKDKIMQEDYCHF